MPAQVVQLNFFRKCNNKVTQINIPLYRKVYSAYQYDQKKYMEIYKKLHDVALKLKKPAIFWNVSPYKILNLCYVKYKPCEFDCSLTPLPKGEGREGTRRRLDERHIFRLKALHKIYETLADEITKNQLTLKFDDRILFNDGIIIFFDSEFGNQAIVQGTEKMPISNKVIIHIELLRMLRKGTKLKKAVKLIKNNYVFE